MNINLFLTLTLSVAAGGAIIIFIGHYLFKNEIRYYLSAKANDNLKNQKATLLPLRLQAHERMIIFVERINPTNLLPRLYQKNIDLTVLQNLALTDINTEYQHNITQQLYLGAKTWEAIKTLKEDTVSMLNNVGHNLPPGSQGIELSKKILQHMGTIPENPYDMTIDLVKADIHRLF